MKQTKPALSALREIEEVRAALNRRIGAINTRITELSQHVSAHTMEVSPIDRARALIAGEQFQHEPEEIKLLRDELEKLHQSLRDTQVPLKFAQTAASAEHCQEFIPAMFSRKRKQIELLKALQKLNDESDSVTLEVHRAGFDLGGELRESKLYEDDLAWQIENLTQDVRRHEIQNTDFGDALLSVRVLSGGQINGVNRQCDDLLDLPEKQARLAALDSRCEIVSPDLLHAARAAKIERIAA